MHVSGLAYVSAVAAEAKKRCPNPPRAGVVVSCPTWVLGTLKNLTPGLERTIFTLTHKTCFVPSIPMKVNSRVLMTLQKPLGLGSRLFCMFLEQGMGPGIYSGGRS